MGNPQTNVYSAAADTESSNANNSQEAIVKPIKSWKGYLWDTWDLPRDQRRLLFKVDAIVLTFASLGYFLKNLDQTNVNNAFLSGMEEDLSMYGNQLVTSTSIWTVGYVIGQIPSNLLLTRVSPRWVIPALEVGWGIATFCTAAVKNYRELYALRFLVGFFESGFYPGIHYLLGSWYTPQELGKRAMIFWLAGTIGTMFSGFLQAAAYTNLHNVHGLSGWRWLFIVDGIITMPLALLGFVFFPNLPQGGKKTWWTSDAEHELSVNRMKAIGRAGKQPWTRTKAKRVLLSWHTHGLLAQELQQETLPLYNDIAGRKVLYWLSFLGNGAGPLILSWINEICSADTEKRALLVAAGNDLAYVVQAVAPNFVWKTTDFPRAYKGYTWSLVMQVLLIVWTAAIQVLLWRDRRAEAKRGVDGVVEEREREREREAEREAEAVDERKV
ncbi:MFS general substrate transporter [Karstenula rhodostoma CBS 690.94]|uniref:MFS general substrate transporter n=1 Tax=Karstenula rhodostoma CBS 690.94 TaxID=1392251 RepID=A0A9P4U7J6_9PLEO|nr:MFS general substrate transporter [Karstenula rhodostoma CBS 690.94]